MNSEHVVLDILSQIVGDELTTHLLLAVFIVPCAFFPRLLIDMDDAGMYFLTGLRDSLCYSKSFTRTTEEE